MFSKSIVTRALALGVAAFTFTSCDEETLNSLGNLSQGDTVAGLKEALKVGVGVAVDRLGSEGYIADASTKIGLPEEAQAVFTAYNALQKVPAASAVLEGVGLGDNLEKNLVTLFNQAATDAVPEAASVFTSAITSMSVQDGESILFGGSGAATTYLKDNTYTGLQTAFHDPITNSMNSVNVAGMTASEAWTKFAEANNTVAKNVSDYKSAIENALSIGSLFMSSEAKGYCNTALTALNSVKVVDSDVSNYVTGKALDGLFLRVSQKEDDIRTNAASRTSDLLKRVFGRLDENK